METQETLICPDCKKEGAAGEKFCKEHGKKLVPATVSAQDKEDDKKQKKELAKKYYKEGSDYCDAESYDLAIGAYKKAEELFPDFSALHHNMGWLYSKLGDADRAIYHLQRYIVLSPDAGDVMAVQSYINVLKQAAEKRKSMIGAFSERDEVMKKALTGQKQKHTSVVIPVGEFVMGSEEARVDAAPEHRVFLNAYEIDRYEVTNAQYWEFLDYLKKPTITASALKEKLAEKTIHQGSGITSTITFPITLSCGLTGMTLMLMRPGQERGCQPKLSGKRQQGDWTKEGFPGK